MINKSPKILFFLLFVVQFLTAQNAPIANEDNFTVVSNSTFVQSAPGVLGNDSDADEHKMVAS